MSQVRYATGVRVDVFHTVDINGQGYKLTNETDYRLYKTYLESDNGYVINYKAKRGMDEKRWLDTLRDYGFGRAYNMGRYLERDTATPDIDIQRLHGKRYVLAFTFGREWYGFGFDGGEYILQLNDGNILLTDFIL